ncbi:MAG: DUF4398 domain-containing protein [Methylobacter sp.]
MQNNLYFPMTLLAVVIVSGCGSMPQNSSLAEAQNSYDSARANPKVTRLAALELEIAGAYLKKADRASCEHASDDIVDHLAYLTKQQVAIAEQTAAWKTAELLVKTATLKRNLARRLAKGAAGAAKRRMLIRQQTVNRQTVELAAAGVNP